MKPLFVAAFLLLTFPRLHAQYSIVSKDGKRIPFKDIAFAATGVRANPAYFFYVGDQGKDSLAVKDIARIESSAANSWYEDYFEQVLVDCHTKGAGDVHISNLTPSSFELRIPHLEIYESKTDKKLWECLNPLLPSNSMIDIYNAREGTYNYQVYYKCDGTLYDTGMVEIHACQSATITIQ